METAKIVEFGWVFVEEQGKGKIIDHFDSMLITFKDPHSLRKAMDDGMVKIEIGESAAS